MLYILLRSSRPTSVSLLCLPALLLLPVYAMAFPSIASQWQSVYEDPAGPCGFASQSMQNVLAESGARCQLCHVNAAGGEPWNAYGWDLRQSGVDFAAVEGLNSDNDFGGFSNFDEICTDAQPGWNANGTNLAFFSDGSTMEATPPPGVDLDPMVPPQPPVADPDGPYSGTVGAPVTFDGSGSTDPDGVIVGYDWDFGDGNTGAGVAPTHTYSTDGIFGVSLTVTDDSGATDTATTTATIGLGNQAPTANPDGPYSGTVGAAVVFDGSGSFDPDGVIVAFEWDFGDGNTGMGVAPTHTYATVGIFNVTLTVTDDAGTTDSATTTATINEPVCDPGKVAVCHKPGANNPRTLCLDSNAVSAHLGHGDTLGACP